MGKARLAGGLLLMLGGATAATAASGAERLVSPPLPGFVVGYTAGNAAQSIKEEVPRGQTVEAWTKMVTTQRFAGLAARTTPAQYAANILASLPGSCPGATSSPAVRVTVAGRAAIRFQADCPGREGKPETFLFLAVAGASDMHVKQVAFRGTKSAADLAWAKGFLAGTVLCSDGDKAAACRG